MRLLLIIFSSINLIAASAQQRSVTTIYFDIDSSNISDKAGNQIEFIVNEIRKKMPNQVTINGYTDISGPDEYNEKLSQVRAEVVLGELKKNLPADINIIMKGFGSRYPISDKLNEQSLNRRVEIILLYTDNPSIVEVEGLKEDANEQRFLINVDDTVNVKAIEGTVIKFSPHSIQNRQGLLIHGKAELIVREYYSTSTIVIAGLHSSSDNGLLQTGGMLRISIVQNGDTMDQKTLKPVEIRMPVIHPELNDMKVFSLPNNQDTSQWINTGRSFNKLKSYWNWSFNITEMKDVYRISDAILTNLQIGKSISEEYNVFRPILPVPMYDRPFAKKVALKTEKIDSVTVRVNAKIKYRPRGFRILRKKYLDTTFTVPFLRSFYEGMTDNLNWINCDRFYKYNNQVDMYVNTPGFNGLNIIAYFKDINAFMPALLLGNRYVIQKVPANMKVCLIAIGKKDGDFYFGKDEVTIKNGSFSLNKIEKTDKVKFKQYMDNL